MLLLRCYLALLLALVALPFAAGCDSGAEDAGTITNPATIQRPDGMGNLSLIHARAYYTVAAGELRVYMIREGLPGFDPSRHEFVALFREGGLPGIGEYSVHTTEGAGAEDFVAGYTRQGQAPAVMLSRSGVVTISSNEDGRLVGTYDVFALQYIGGQVGLGRFLGEFEAERVEPEALPRYPFEVPN